MAHTNRNIASQPQYQLKHRLVGSIIVVSIAVFGIPVLLSKPYNSPRPTAASDTTAPPVGSLKKIFRAVLKTPEPLRNSLPEIPTIKKKSTPSKTVSAVDIATVAATATTSSSGWAVRVGTFSQIANINSVVKQLESHGFTAQKTRVTTAQGKQAIRIWLGPYTQRETADTISKLLKNIFGEKGFIIKHAP